MSRHRAARFLFWTMVCLFSLVVLLFLGAGMYISYVNGLIDTRVEQLQATRSSQFYSLMPPLSVNQKFTRQDLISLFEHLALTEKVEGEELSVGSYHIEKSTETLLSVKMFLPAFTGAGHATDQMRLNLFLEGEESKFTIKQILRMDDQMTLAKVDLPPKQIGHYFAGRLRTQNSVALSDIPVSLRLGVMAIEDIEFLEHHGVSIRGIVRALWKDLLARKIVQGGSTITQQLMKNLFFSHEKIFSRKFKEALFALLTEARHSKEAILEAYLNEVYLGQWGIHEIHGMAEGARYYFNRDISTVTLAQSATLAAVVNAPNLYEPRRSQGKTLQRRNLVLKKMLNASFIDASEYEAAVREPLGVLGLEKNLDDAQYFLDLVMGTIPSHVKEKLDTDALTVYVPLNSFLQSAATQSLTKHLDQLESSYASLKKNALRGVHLQGALITVNLKECTITALQGGRSYRQTQFNRILKGIRQPGSLFKPFVFLAAFGKERDPLTPVTVLEDVEFEWTYDKQRWSPRNYDKIFRGGVTARQALEQSLNVPTARAASVVGMEEVVDVLQRAGIQSPLPEVPSISLGSADVSPFELAEAYATLANLGERCRLRSYLSVFDENKNLVVENKLEFFSTLNPQASFLITHVLKGVFTHGTAKAAKASGLALSHFAGKTGTTNDYKDAWFVGFSPELLVLVWVGYDEKEAVGLTGSSAALPVWIDFMKNVGPFFPEVDFVRPDGLVEVLTDRTSGKVAGTRCPDPQVEYFITDTEVTQQCPMH